MKRLPYDDGALQRLEEMTDRVSHFITRLLRLAALNDPEATKMEEVDFSSLVGEILSYFKVVATENRIKIKTNITGQVRVVGDSRMLEEMILNILSNAVKFIDNEHQISITLTAEKGRASLKIRDSGLGIPEEDLSKLFQRFYRGNHGKRDGTGLGLAICKRIVALHKGTIDIRSKLNQGTTVEVSLPLVA